MNFFAAPLVLAVISLGHAAPSLAETRMPEPVHIAVRLSPEFLERGLHGTVLLQVVASPENKVESQTVLESSGSQELDDYAQTRLAGAPIDPDLIKNQARTLDLEVDLYAFDIGMDFSKSYSCAQAVRDHDWYVANNPDEKFERGKYYNMFGGLALLSDREEIAFAKNPKLRDQAWLAALEHCREAGEQRFLSAVILSAKGIGQ